MTLGMRWHSSATAGGYMVTRRREGRYVGEGELMGRGGWFFNNNNNKMVIKPQGGREIERVCLWN